MCLCVYLHMCVCVCICPWDRGSVAVAQVPSHFTAEEMELRRTLASFGTYSTPHKEGWFWPLVPYLPLPG